ncbi:uncharacterized protein si:dkey-117m1.4 isoform X1 [Triplophysa dalaica]|uniref:uncharacterized protein si:dkey-117m1.4 isoform X1 n=1 Tax=Triplophysa dalaica TaxID=1582913 RepID=UPI0024DF4FB2|nr:uncharacterized protein si:dkey-117m1.4 isoform X1 [Triplophysa dalaica]
MAEIVRSLFDYREPPTLDSDGESSKPPLPRGRGCGRKRKGTPVKVCDRVFATEDEEESTLAHSYGLEKGDSKETHNRERPPATDGPYYETQSAELCAGEMGEEGTSGGNGAMSYPLPPNCRIREVHCGNQVRLIVIAIRDIAKGEEITVDYSLTEWGENAVGFHSTVPSNSLECSSDHENKVKKVKEEESGPLPVSVSEYLTPSWSLSPSSSPLSHSEPSDSDHDSEDASAELRMPTAQRRKKHKASPPARAKEIPVQQPPSHPPSFPLSLSPSSLQSTAPSRPVFKCPAPAGVPANSVSVSVGRGQSSVAEKQRCVYCRRHFRSLQRHMDKHHAHQPDMQSALNQAHSTFLQNSPPLSSSSSNHFQCPQRVEVAKPQSTQTSSLSPVRKSPALSCPTRKSAPPPVTPPRREGVPVSVLKKSPPTPATPPRKGGRKIKREKDDVKVSENTKATEVPTPALVEQLKEAESKPLKEEREELEGDDESEAEDKNDLSSLRRPHMLPLLSSLSSLVLYLRRLQHSAFISLTRSPQSAEAWRLLCHSSLALLILYNRRRECEVSKLTISEYQARITPHSPSPVPLGTPPALTPLEASLSPFERMVLPHLPRVGVQGKRGRVQPLILPPHSEACLEMLLLTRAGVGIDPQNPYVFARPYHSPATPLRGTDLLRSLARSSGTRHSRALTQTRLRRQVAILTQLLFLSEGEEEGERGAAIQRLESFLEKEYHVTQSCTTIGQDPGLMGLIGRVVLCGERDGVLFRGMSLHHICLELDVLSGNSADSLSEESDVEQRKAKPKMTSPTTAVMIKKTTVNSKSPRPKKMNSSSPVSAGRKRTSGQPKPGKRGVLKRPWSEAERAAVESHLVHNIMELRVPAKADCERCLELCPLLVSNRRDWRAVKFYCHNRIQLLKKTQQRRGPPTVSVC